MNQSHNAPHEAILAKMRALMASNPEESLPDHSAASLLDSYLDSVRDQYTPDGPELDGHGCPTADMELLYLMGVPIDAPARPTLRERIRVKPEQLARRARKFLTLGAVYTQRETFAKQQAEGLKWANWLATFMNAADVREMVRRHKGSKSA